MAASEVRLPLTMIVEQGCRLSPATPYDYELFDKRYKLGQELEVSFHARKSRQQEKWFWLKVNQIVDNTEYPDSYSLVKAAMVRLRYVNSIQLIGTPGAPPSFLLEPRSLSTFDRNEFNEFVERFWQLLSTEVIPGLDLKAFLDGGKIFIDEELV
jgi:hypothetical protein